MLRNGKEKETKIFQRDENGNEHLNKSIKELNISSPAGEDEGMVRIYIYITSVD